MTVPDFQTVLLPTLKLSADKKERTLSEAIDALALHFKLSEDDRKQLLPSGRQRRFDNRVTWAVTYLSKANLLKRTGRGIFQITERGLELLKNPPDRITIGYLMRYPAFAAWKDVSVLPEDRAVQPISSDDTTPEELLENSYLNLRQSLAADLVERVKQCPPAFFERLVVDLLVSMGYGGSRKDAGEAVGQSGDGGIDGIIKEDRLGLDVVYIQAKRWQAAVGSGVVREFAGSLEGHRAQKGVLITTSQFSADAKAFVEKVGKKIILIGGQHLAELMIDFNIGVTPVSSYEVKKIDLDYFPEDVISPTAGAENDPAI